MRTQYRKTTKDYLKQAAINGDIFFLYKFEILIHHQQLKQCLNINWTNQPA